MLECVINVSEGRRREVIDSLVAAGGASVLDLHCDAHHNRSVLTLASEEVEAAAREVGRLAVRSIDLRTHTGAHPRLGALDVVPFVALEGTAPSSAVAARDRYASWAAAELELPCFLYGPERSLPEVRQGAFRRLRPDAGPPAAHPTAGAVCVGARPPLIAYNLWLAPGTPLEEARRVAGALRGNRLRALGLQVGERVQVSTNLLDPLRLGFEAAYDAVADEVAVERAEVVGLAPASTLDAVPRHRWPALGLDASMAIEARLDGLRSC
jgi:glutamate formiminotransferase